MKTADDGAVLKSRAARVVTGPGAWPPSGQRVWNVIAILDRTPVGTDLGSSGVLCGTAMYQWKLGRTLPPDIGRAIQPCARASGGATKPSQVAMYWRKRRPSPSLARYSAVTGSGTGWKAGSARARRGKSWWRMAARPII